MANKGDGNQLSFEFVCVSPRTSESKIIDFQAIYQGRNVVSIAERVNRTNSDFTEKLFRRIIARAEHIR